MKVRPPLKCFTEVLKENKKRQRRNRERERERELNFNISKADDIVSDRSLSSSIATMGTCTKNTTIGKRPLQ